jgi:hypothetical protein
MSFLPLSAGKVYICFAGGWTSIQAQGAQSATNAGRACEEKMARPYPIPARIVGVSESATFTGNQWFSYAILSIRWARILRGESSKGV